MQLSTVPLDSDIQSLAVVVIRSLPPIYVSSERTYGEGSVFAADFYLPVTKHPSF